MEGSNLSAEILRQVARARIVAAGLETGYLPEGYLQAVRQADPAAGLRALLRGEAHEDSVQLWARGRLDLTLEALVQMPACQGWFSSEDRRKAEARLRDWRSIDPMEVVAALVETAAHPLYGAEDVDWGE